MPPHRQGEGGSQTQDQTTPTGDGSVTHQARSGGGPGKDFLADTRWSNGWWVHRELQMPEDLPDHLALHDGGDDPQRPPLTPRAACHIQCKDALQQS